MGIKVFLVEPIYGESFLEGHRGWPPHKTIIGWRCPDTGEEKKHNYEWPAGAIWRAVWMPVNWCWENETEPHLIVRCPNGDGVRDWDIDSRCSKCTLPDDKVHRCWVRHGDVPVLTVDKVGLTCAAGAGSIQLPLWHGFLRNGELVAC